MGEGGSYDAHVLCGHLARGELKFTLSWKLKVWTSRRDDPSQSLCMYLLHMELKLIMNYPVGATSNITDHVTKRTLFGKICHNNNYVWSNWREVHYKISVGLKIPSHLYSDLSGADSARYFTSSLDDTMTSTRVHAPTKILSRVCVGLNITRPLWCTHMYAQVPMACVINSANLLLYGDPQIGTHVKNDIDCRYRPRSHPPIIGFMFRVSEPSPWRLAVKPDICKAKRIW